MDQTTPGQRERHGDIAKPSYDLAMTDPANRAKPVGPPPPVDDVRPPSGSTEQAGGSSSGPGTPPGQPYVRVYQWSSSGRRVPWFAILLLVLGVGLLVQELTGLGFMGVVVLGLGIALGVLWLWRGVVGATVPALVLTAWGGANVLADLGALGGEGWSTLLVGIAFLAGWAIGHWQQARRTWALVLGVIFGLIGVSEVSDILPANIDGGTIMAGVLIVGGIYLILRSRGWSVTGSRPPA